VTRPSLLRSTLSFSGGTFVSRILGLVREIVFATVFGATAATDAFWVAFRIPNFMRRLFAEGSFSTAFVPALTEVKERGSPEELRLMIARVAGTLGAVLLVISALGVLFAPEVTAMFAPGSRDEPVKFAMTADMLRITFPFLLFISLTAMAGAVLNTFHRFALPALTPVVMNLCMIAAALWWSPYFDVPVTSMAWAILIAGVVQLLVQLPALAKLGLLAWPRWGLAAPEVREVMKLMVPTPFGPPVTPVNRLVTNFGGGKKPPRGLYIWGGVGRGKTLMMDAFFNVSTLKRKRRTHFHEFMREIHAEMQKHTGEEDPLEPIAAKIAKQLRLLCFDEFHVSDIADSMILGRLLDLLAAQGVVLVMTSNYRPDDLYPNGLQRARFLPAIELLKIELDVIEISGKRDHRRRILESRFPQP